MNLKNSSQSQPQSLSNVFPKINKQHSNYTQNYIHHKLSQNYGTSQIYFHTHLIEDIIKSKKKNPLTITMKDVKFNEEEEFMDAYYHIEESSRELPQLFQYYKYYTQHPVCYLKSEYQVMYEYQEKKKAFLYKKLKKVLELSESMISLEDSEKNKKSKINEFNQVKFNILSLLNLTKKSRQGESKKTINSIPQKDESYYFTQITTNLNNVFGVSRLKTLDKIDKNFKIFPQKISFHKPKKLIQFNKNPTLQTMLESTNISHNHKNMVLKKGHQKQHRRYGSNEDLRVKVQKKVKPRRGNSMENETISQMCGQKNIVKLKKYRKNSKKGQVKNNVVLKVNIEDMKKKINKQKSQFCKGLACPSQRKLRIKKKN